MIILNEIGGEVSLKKSDVLINATQYLVQSEQKLLKHKKIIEKDDAPEQMDRYHNLLIDLYTDKELTAARRIIHIIASGNYMRNLDYYSNKNNVELILLGLKAQYAIENALYHVPMPSIQLTDYDLPKFKGIERFEKNIDFIKNQVYNQNLSYITKRDFEQVMKRRRYILLDKATIIWYTLKCKVPKAVKVLGVNTLLCIAYEIHAPSIHYKR